MLSKRGAKWSQNSYAHGKKDLYDPLTNPGGVVSFANAENWLMQDEITDFLNAHNHFDKSCCTYGEGSTGSLRLRDAMARHMNAHFRPARAVTAEEVTFAAGVTDLNEVCALLTCDPGQSVMLGRPVYGSFAGDLGTRTGVSLEYVSVGDTDQFSPACVALYEAGYEEARVRGKDIRALLICNPHNPLGRCYPRETLVGLLRFCASKNIHLISDEIYALSMYDPVDGEPESFTSVRSIDFTGIIDPSLVHVLYGMSKDFGAAGLRLGCLVSQNEQFTRATRATCRFSWPSQYSMALAANLLEDQAFVREFLAKSRQRLTRARALAEVLLTEAGIEYHKKGNAGFFIWLDLSDHLSTTTTTTTTTDNNDDDENSNEAVGWAAHNQLDRRFREVAGVVMSGGTTNRAPRPGNFRLIFCVEEPVLREGIRRFGFLT
ncbi:acc synthase [Xylariomycetidae sp. FL2044]|nr:acc synthase [Xylariomycetidae sp. FL2044]